MRNDRQNKEGEILDDSARPETENKKACTREKLATKGNKEPIAPQGETQAKVEKNKNKTTDCVRQRGVYDPDDVYVMLRVWCASWDLLETRERYERKRGLSDDT